MKRNMVLKHHYQEPKKNSKMLHERELYFWQMYEKNSNGILLQKNLKLC